MASLPSITGAGLITDPKTGYLTPTGGSAYHGFNAKKKQNFCRLAETMWPNVTAICKKIGIDRNTFTNHYLVDPLFKQHIDAFKEALCDNVEADMVGYAKEKANYLDRITILRAHRPEVYDPAKKVIMQHQRTHDEDATARRLADTRKFVDAEIVQPEQIPPATPAKD